MKFLLYAAPASKKAKCPWRLFFLSLSLGITPFTPLHAKENITIKQAHVYVIHGFMASPTDHWFQWLHRDLERLGISVKVLHLPNSHAPDPVSWQKTLAEELGELDENTFLVAHSLGCVSLLKYLHDRTSNQPIGGMILVSGFIDPLPELPQLNDFVDGEIDFKKIIDIVRKRIVIGSPQDSIVPYALTKSLANDLASDLYSIDNAGHFLADDGYVTFPQLHDILMQMISK